MHALYASNSNRVGDLNFSENEEITVLQADAQWWYGRTNRAEGWFPSNYVEREPDADTLYGHGKFDYAALREDELSFKAGDILTIHGLAEKDWLDAELGGRRGVVPKPYVDFVDKSVALSASASPSVSAGGAEEKRKEAIKEFFETEKTYVKHLKMVAQVCEQLLRSVIAS